MSTHSRGPVRGEAVLAVYSHARSNRLAEFTFAHPEVLCAVGVFLVAISLPYPTLAAVLAGLTAVTMTVTGWVLSIQDGHGTCERLIREFRAEAEEETS